MVNMKKFLLIAAAVMTVLAVALACVGLYLVHTPEYALMKIQKDVQANGVDGLMPHLTENAKLQLGTLAAVADNELVRSIMGVLNQEDYIEVLKSELQNVQWECEDILKSAERATVMVNFRYGTKISGSIDIELVRDDGWKIDELNLPKFDMPSLFG